MKAHTIKFGCNYIRMEGVKYFENYLELLPEENFHFLVP